MVAAVGFRWLGAAQPNVWTIPIDVLAAGDEQHVAYVGGGDWKGPGKCAGRLMPGAEALRKQLYKRFPQIADIHGYECRPIVGRPTKMSVHATGRAVDVMIPTDDGKANSALGDPIGNWLVENAEALGVQFIIWDRTTWMASRELGKKAKPYSGQHPHHDHLHVELHPSASGTVPTSGTSKLWIVGALVGAVVLFAGVGD